MRNASKLFLDLALVALCVAGFSCDKAGSPVPADPALLGRWYQVPLRGTYHTTLPARGIEFLAGGRVRTYVKDSLVLEGNYRHLRDASVDLAPGFSLVEYDVRSIVGNQVFPNKRTYAVQRDTLYLNTPAYKNTTNCFPIYERYSRTPPGKVGTR